MIFFDKFYLIKVLTSDIIITLEYYYTHLNYKTMKKIIIMFALLMSVASVSAQSKFIEDTNWKLHCSPTLYGGYNFLENTAITGVAIPIYVNFLRAELDVGYSYLNTYLGHKDFVYFSPSIGLQYGNKVRGYLMFGWTNWPHLIKVGAPNYECPGDRFYSDLIHAKLKCGLEVVLTKKLFLNVDLGYVFTSKGDDYHQYFDNFALRTGIGWRF